MQGGMQKVILHAIVIINAHGDQRAFIASKLEKPVQLLHRLQTHIHAYVAINITTWITHVVNLVKYHPPYLTHHLEMQVNKIVKPSD